MYSVEKIIKPSEELCLFRKTFFEYKSECWVKILEEMKSLEGRESLGKHCNGFIVLLCPVHLWVSRIQHVAYTSTQKIFISRCSSWPLLPLPWFCPHRCPHLEICMLFPKEDLPIQVWDKSSVLVLLWLIRTPLSTLLNMRFPAQFLGLLLLWFPGKDGEGMRKRMAGELWSSTALHVCSLHVRCVWLVLQMGMGCLDLLVRKVPEGRKSCVLVRLVTGRWGWHGWCLEVSLNFTDVRLTIVIVRFCCMTQNHRIWE